MAEEQDKKANQSGAESYKGLASAMYKQGDHGSALYLYRAAQSLFIDAGNPSAAEEILTQFVPRVKGGMLVEFRKIAAERNLTVNDNNFQTLLEEHSPSYNKYKTMMGMFTDLNVALEKGADCFRKELETMVRNAAEGLKGAKNAEYLGENLEKIMEWEEWKEDIHIDLPSCYSGLVALSNQDLAGNYLEEESMLREQLERIKRFKEHSR